MYSTIGSYHRTHSVFVKCAAHSTGRSGSRVEFLLKTDGGYPRDAEVTLFTLANPENYLHFCFCDFYFDNICSVYFPISPFCLFQMLLQGFARVIKLTSSSLGYPLWVFNEKSNLPDLGPPKISPPSFEHTLMARGSFPNSAFIFTNNCFFPEKKPLHISGSWPRRVRFLHFWAIRSQPFVQPQ